MADLFLSSFISDYLTNLPADIHKSLQQIRDFDAIVEKETCFLELARSVYVQHLKELSEPKFIATLSKEQLKNLGEIETKIEARHVLQAVKDGFDEFSEEVCLKMEEFEEKYAEVEEVKEKESKKKSKNASKDRTYSKRRRSSSKADISEVSQDDTENENVPKKIMNDFLLEFLNPENEHNFCATKLLNMNSATLLDTINKNAASNLASSSSKYLLCTDSYSSVDKVIQNFDSQMKDYEENLRKLIGFYIPPSEESTAVRNNKRAVENLYSRVIREKEADAQNDKLVAFQAMAINNLNKKDRRKAIQALEASMTSSSRQKAGGAAAASFTTSGNDFDTAIDANEPLYCICKKPAYGEMIACDNEECPNEWFHLGCVNLVKLPQANHKWYCKECKPLFVSK